MKLYEKHPALQVRDKEVLAIQDTVCIEDTFRLYLNDLPLAQIVASPHQLKELGTGFVICEGLAQNVEKVLLSGNDIRVYASTSAQIDYELRSSGCIGVRGMPKIVESSLVIEQEQILHIIAQTESEVWKKTGGVHCAVLFKGKELIARSNDIGRHNTIDKVVGFAVLNHIDLSKCVIGCTGRQPAGMISKIANAGIPIVISKAATTDAGIILADRSAVTLICFARDNRFTVYTHPERISGLTEQSSISSKESLCLNAAG